MTINKLNSLAQDAMVSMLLKSTKELLTALEKPDNLIEIDDKKNQVELIHTAFLESFLEKRTAERPASGQPI